MAVSTGYQQGSKLVEPPSPWAVSIGSRGCSKAVEAPGCNGAKGQGKSKRTTQAFHPYGC